MPYPFTIRGIEIPGHRALGTLIAVDLARGGRTVHPHGGPERWLVEAADVGALDADALRGIARALLASTRPAAVACAARLIASRPLPTLGPHLVAALFQHDLGVLLGLSDAGRSIEAELALAAAMVSDLSHPAWRARVLGALRGSGESLAEARVLRRWATPEELRTWGDDLRLEADPRVLAVLDSGD